MRARVATGLAVFFVGVWAGAYTHSFVVGTWMETPHALTVGLVLCAGIIIGVSYDEPRPYWADDTDAPPTVRDTERA